MEQLALELYRTAKDITGFDLGVVIALILLVVLLMIFLLVFLIALVFRRSA